ncbi:succinate dehydrogenase iron-sulfur subunit [Terribacillus saccharophilus]|jgi:succinate dehydrogenase / fumarate reductase, iron-sulfur subunit|uniref:succinate dehydrogenase n=1 Tax=Terribacillus saccharophilus TaxID=361277 RepID=A0A268AC67_9BACI|nr:succinate dehydrogenase iron-sulfur subunit [Terribacillus saccharophilus]PAD21669.1 succinate dehydrogenase iron-sulfur subunit [Terribacillus saccharophilus]PAD33789.1 succinate dehydrogenase iron-sulfur subunit [Terribacillus saccharophilus]PAD95101.1 succinate dehydrogenase iron-sulfur subunit [Terribacillus saccharophilus]PAE00660.1 succinate dehydrogenase iron-sulfur subunit [Terribacillus saccharophilus]PAF19923.1 succinate dehydrogenase iron-sulfur subunit [Terribacillus saccharophi
MEATKTKQETITIIVTRQNDPSSAPYEETFHVPYRENMNVISALMEIRRNPVNAEGKETTPIYWDMNCLEEVCGACSMVINGTPRQSCAALIDKLEQPIRLEPMATFPIIRDLAVDRSQMFDSLKKVKAWVPIDGTYDLGPGPRMPEKKRQWAYELSKCMTCGVCLEACPNVNDKSDFIGPAPISQVRLFNSHPTGAMNKGERLEALMGEGGIGSCGNSQNCVQVCPKGIPLTTSIAEMNRATNIQSFKNFFGSDTNY